MNLTIAKEQILAGLQAVQNIVSTRTTLPILSNVLLKAEGDRLELTATDLTSPSPALSKPASRSPGPPPSRSKNFLASSAS